MNASLPIARFAWYLVLILVVASGCRRSPPTPLVAPPAAPNSPAVAAQETEDDSKPESTAASTSPAADSDGPADLAPTEEPPQADGAAATDAAGNGAAGNGAAGNDAAGNDAAGNDDAAAGDGEPATDAGLAASGDLDRVADDSAAADITVDAPEANLESTHPPSERFALLTPGGPLIVDVRITIDGDVHSSALETLVEDAYAAADTDGDGERTWEEVANSPKFMYGQFGNLPITDDAQKRQLITMYDRNEDGLVNRDELPRFVTRNVGRARSFSLRSSNEYRSANRSRSPVRRLIDADRDGAIIPAEMAAAPSRLLGRDANDDQIITLADFNDDVQAMPGQMSNRRRTTEPDTCILIDDDINWGYASFALQELYAYGDTVGVSDWPLTPGLFATLDTDQDELLSREEVEQLATVKPHLRLVARFGVKDTAEGPRVTSLELDSIDPALEETVTAVRTHQRRVSIELSRVEVEFFVNEDPSLSNYQEVAQAQFNTLDTDGNGYLNEEEIPAQLPGLNVPFAGVDADEDGKVYLEELATFLELRQRAYRGQIRARAADQEDALFTALDTSGDGRLHAREIAATPAMLARMDRNEDGELQSHEIPGSMVVGFVRGNPQQDASLFVMPTGVSETDNERLPRWFLGMDANRDGEIGSHEFLGTTAQFAQFDNDGDGFIHPDELPAELLAPAESTEEPAATVEPEADAAEPKADAVETEAESLTDAAS